MNSEQTRVLTNAIQLFQALEKHRESDGRFAGSMHWKHISGRDYLYRGFSGGRNHSLGLRNRETEEIKQRFEAGARAHKKRTMELLAQVKIHSGYVKVNHLNRFPISGARILRALQKAGVPNRVIGTNALYAYETGAGVLFMPDQLATDDIDLLMDARQSVKITANLKKRTLLSLLKDTDKSFKRLSDSPYEFAASNDKGYRVEFITQGNKDPMLPSDFSRLLKQGDLQPIGIDSLKWCVSSPRFTEIVFDTRGMPLTVDTVDPRAFALHKWHVSQRSDRHPRKRRRDEAQARAVAAVVSRELRHLPATEVITRLFPSSVVNRDSRSEDEFSI